jgi:hypothetical protein
VTRELTRRDAIVALGAGTTLGTAGLLASGSGQSTFALDAEEIETMRAVAETVYPDSVTATTEFVEEYVDGQPRERQEEIAETIARLDDGSRRHTGRPFAALSSSDRKTVLTRLGVGRVESNPDGSVPERIRYQLVNSTLYALFVSPTGSELVGIENPTGHPGGDESLFRPPEGER